MGEMNGFEVKLPLEQLCKPSSGVLGWWDKTLSGATIGTLLIFLAECGLVAKLCDASIVDIAVDAQSHGIKNISIGEWRCLDANECDDAVLSVLAGIESVDKVFACGGDAGFQALGSQLSNTHKIWPLAGRCGLPAPYDTTKYVQALWMEVGRFAPLEFRPHIRKWADEAIRSQFGKRPTVGLHLKNAPHQGAGFLSMADESSWCEFLSMANDQYEVGFLLLGDDPVEKRILKLPNVALAREIGAECFGQHLALLGQCAGFMGMMSAICNMALFSDTPYAIFKNPDHHRDEMLMEIGIEDHYPFATQQQKVFRINETPASLLFELRRMPFIKGALR